MLAWIALASFVVGAWSVRWLDAFRRARLRRALTAQIAVVGDRKH
jgi:hypothetical protein